MTREVCGGIVQPSNGPWTNCTRPKGHVGPHENNDVHPEPVQLETPRCGNYTDYWECACELPLGHAGNHRYVNGLGELIQWPSSNAGVVEVRNFGTGATRDSEQGKLDPEGFLNPLVLDTYYRYMDKHRHLNDGSLRGSDNWQAGMPVDVYMKSLARHWHDVWLLHRGYQVPRPENGEVPTMMDSLCGLFFNVQGVMLELLKETP